MDRSYRDSRINRIFEGTNEINRMLTLDMMLKRALKGQLDLLGPAQAVAAELTGIPDFNQEEDTALFAAEKKIIANLKKVGLMIAGAAVQKLQTKLSHEQELLMHLADILIQVYGAESAILRAEKVAGVQGEAAAKLYIDMAQLTVHRAISVIKDAGTEAIYAFAEGDEMRMMLLGLKRFTKIEPVNLKNLRREIADALIEANGWAIHF